jgi:hypothetical protein
MSKNYETIELATKKKQKNQQKIVYPTNLKRGFVPPFWYRKKEKSDTNGCGVYEMMASFSYVVGTW